MDSDENQQILLLNQMQEVLKSRKDVMDEDFKQKCRLRYNLVKFGEEFLSQEAFDRLISILNDGGVNLLPMPKLKSKATTKKESLPPKKANVEEMRQKIAQMSKILDEVWTNLKDKQKIREQKPQQKPPIQPVPVETLPEKANLVQVELKVSFPFESDTVFETMNERAERDSDFYNLLVDKMKEIDQKNRQKKGIRPVFDMIFGKKFVSSYHVMKSVKRDVEGPDGILKPAFERFLFRNALKDVFSDDDPLELNKELRKWHLARQKIFKRQKQQRESQALFKQDDEDHSLSSSKRSMDQESDNEESLAKKPKEDNETSSTPLNIALPFETDTVFEAMNERAEKDPGFYAKLIVEMKKIDRKVREKRGWGPVFDLIFGKDFARFYYLRLYNKSDRDMNTVHGSLKSISKLFLFKNGIKDAFPTDDPYKVAEELQTWFSKRRVAYRKRFMEHKQKQEKMNLMNSGDSSAI